MKNDIFSNRREFDLGKLEEGSLIDNPLILFKKWVDMAMNSKIKDANAFVLSTAVNNEVDSRVLLLRGINKGLEFYSNYNSAKGLQLGKNSLVSINFFWAELDKQIRVKAKVERMNPEKSSEYFISRPRASKVGAWASNQSNPIDSREYLENRVVEFDNKFNNKEVVRPDNWGGYVAKPFYIEFWQGRPSRLHDRIVYELKGDSWNIYRLAP